MSAVARRDAMMRHARALWAALLFVLGACAGTTMHRIAYTPLGPPAADASAWRLVVVPFTDGRPARRTPPRIDATYLLMVPFVPYVSRDYERLDESRAAEELLRGTLPQAEHLFEVQLARAVAADLAASGLFADVRFATVAPPDADLVLGGTIVSTRLTASATSYLLGLPGMLLWLTGLPNGRTSVEIALELALHDHTGAVRWRYPLHAETRRLVDLYTGSAHQLSTGAGPVSLPRYGRNDKGIDPDSLWAFHSDALRTAMAPARRALAAYVGDGVHR